MSPNARMARIASLENMLSISSNSLVAMASQLSEAEERERAFTGPKRWNQLRSMADAKSLLQYMFNSVAESRYRLLSVWIVSFSFYTIVKNLVWMSFHSLQPRSAQWEAFRVHKCENLLHHYYNNWLVSNLYRVLGRDLNKELRELQEYFRTDLWRLFKISWSFLYFIVNCFNTTKTKIKYTNSCNRPQLIRSKVDDDDDDKINNI